MKKIIICSFLAFIFLNSFGQNNSEIDSKSVKFPRYTNLSAINSAIPSPTSGMEVYNLATQSNWYYNGAAWTNMNSGGFVLPYSQTQNSTGDLFSVTSTASATFSTPSAISGIFNGSNSISTSTPFAAGVKGIVLNTANLIGGVAAGVIGLGQNPNAMGVYGNSNNYFGVYGISSSSSFAGVNGYSDNATGVEGSSNFGVGGRFSSGHSYALYSGIGNVVLSGFTQLGGEDASVPKIKLKKIVTTTPSSSNPNSYVFVAHGLNSNKILSVNAIVTNGNYKFIPNTPTRFYTVNVDDSSNSSIPSVAVGVGSLAESSLVMGVPITILITYEE